MAFHPEVMPDLQQRILRTTGSFATRAGFYLAGGTAIAIRLGHRRSIDLDWFTSGVIADPMRLAGEIRQVLPNFEVTDTAKGTLHGQAEAVKLSFLEYRYPLLGDPSEWDEYGGRLAALEDLACMKLSAIAGRGAKKDFIDLYALGASHFTLDEMLTLYQRKFAVRDVGHVVMSLSYFDDAEAEDMPEMLWDADWVGIKRTIEDRVRELLLGPETQQPREGPTP